MTGTAQEMTDEAIKGLPDKQAALRTCALLSGKKLKTIAYEIEIEASHLSKMLNPSDDPRHFPPNKENELMTLCGNEIPLAWAMLSRGYPSPRTAAELVRENAQLRARVDELVREVTALRGEQRLVMNVFKNMEVR